MKVVGVDRARGGWAVVALGDEVEVEFIPTFADVVSHFTDAAVIAVDMPVGLVDDGWRDCDGLAKRWLGARHSTVFATPPRDVLLAPAYAEANERCRALTGKGLSRQSFGLFASILEVAAVAVVAQRPIYEVHPEMAFGLMAGVAALPEPKKTPMGAARRRALLASNGVDVPTGANHDVIDAAAVAVIARRIATGVARPMPDPPQHGHIAVWL